MAALLGRSRMTLANADTRIDTVLESLDLKLAVELVQEVCRVPSVLGEEGPLAALLASVMSKLGFEAVGLHEVLPDRPNAVGSVDFGPGPSVVLTGHMDTKPVSRGWRATEPFSGELIDGAVYGHGIMDMKAALACQIAAIDALARSGVTSSGKLSLAAVSDHMGEQRGSIAYFDSHPVDLCVLGELTDNQVCIGHRGRYYFDVTCVGRSAHTCHKHAAVNANVLAAHAIIAIDRSHYEPDLPKEVARLFGSETFVVPGRVYGGLAPGGPSMIPDECVIRVDCRPQPGVTPEEVRAEIGRCLEQARRSLPSFEASIELADLKPGYMADPDSRVVRLMVEAVASVSDGEEPQLVVEDWLGDTSSFGRHVPTVIFGPGGPPVYCADEHLSVEEIEMATKAYAAFAALALADEPDDAEVGTAS